MNAQHLYIKLYKETRWQRFQRKVLRRKTLWYKKPEGSYTNTKPVTWPSVGRSQTITHISLWDAKEDGQFLGSFEIKP